jgi:cytochrome c-type biogenesis protein CcmF
MRLPLGALATTVLVSLAAGVRDPFALLAFAFGAFALTTNLLQFWIGARARRAAHAESWPVALARLISGNRHRYGGYLAHIGVLLCAVGIAASSAFKTEREVTLTPGESVRVGSLDVRLDGVWGRDEVARTSIGADVSVLENGRVIAKLEPRQHFYPSSDNPIPTPAVRSTVRRDVYVNLMAFSDKGSSATVRVLVEPLVVWIWVGGGIVCLGALVGLWPRRRRSPQAAAVAQPTRSHPRSHGGRTIPAEVAP